MAQHDIDIASVPDQHVRMTGLRTTARPAPAKTSRVPARMQSARDPARAARTGLPDTLKRGIEALSGFSLDRVRVHYRSPAPARVGAQAYAKAGEIHLGPGFEHHLPHEAWHLVQQAQGRVRVTGRSPTGERLNTDHHLEHEADVMGQRAVSAQAGALHPVMRAPAVQPAPVVQLASGAQAKKNKPTAVKTTGKHGWTKAKLGRYLDHLRLRGPLRVAKGRPVAKLVRKFVKARRLAEPGFNGLRLADTPTSGHHTPAIALAETLPSSSPLGYGGARGSLAERSQPRHFFQGSSAQRSNAHGIVHMAEDIAGTGSRNSPSFGGTDAQLAQTLVLAHIGLEHDNPMLGSDDRTPIMTTVEAQTAHAQAPVPAKKAHKIADSTREIFKKRKVATNFTIMSDNDTDSEPESDEDEWPNHRDK
jgi:hypothetical protein